MFSGENQDSLAQEGKADSEKKLRIWAILLNMYCKSRRYGGRVGCLKRKIV